MSDGIYTLRRDPFARGEYVRYSVGAGVCRWCGQQRKRLYEYLWWPDDKRPPSRTGRAGFCNFRCFEEYSGGG